MVLVDLPGGICHKRVQDLVVSLRMSESLRISPSGGGGFRNILLYPTDFCLNGVLTVYGTS